MSAHGPGGADRPPVNLAKVSLTKSAPAVNLTAAGQPQGIMTVALNWTSTWSAPVDLDLGCLYELYDGRVGVVQALGGALGNLYQPPFIMLGGDDRTGQGGGEVMWINLHQPEMFRRILIFAFIYEGVANWADANGVVTMFPTAGPPVEVRLDCPEPGANICAIAQLYAHAGGMAVAREVRYFHGLQPELDRAYGWGMQWTPRRK